MQADVVEPPDTFQGGDFDFLAGSQQLAGFEQFGFEQFGFEQFVHGFIRELS